MLIMKSIGYASITVENANFNVIKIAGKKSTLTLEKVVESHLHEPLTTMELLADDDGSKRY